MIFASDLDRTLIYSHKFIKEDCSKEQVIDIERKTTDGKCNIISYMSKDTLEGLKKVDKQGYFIPVTTRSKAQYQRIEVFQDVIKPKYAITSNGGNIFVDGQIDEKWQKIVNLTLKSIPVGIDEAYDNFPHENTYQWLVSLKKVEGIFFYCVVEEALFKRSFLEGFRKYLESNGWRVHFHGRKIYFMPEPISKEHALKYIVDNYIGESSQLHTAGDSDMDISMAPISDVFHVPRHGEIFKNLDNYPENKHKYMVTENKGFHASEEIVEKVLGFIHRE